MNNDKWFFRIAAIAIFSTAVGIIIAVFGMLLNLPFDEMAIFVKIPLGVGAFLTIPLLFFLVRKMWDCTKN